MIRFLDFDGVIVDSIGECYMVSKKAYYGHSLFPYAEDKYKEIFYKNRGLVRPAYEYRTLHRAIEFYMQNKSKDVESEFKKNTSKKITIEEDFFEKEFFYVRKLYSSYDFNTWAKMNPLTDFGNILANKHNSDTYIVTTKNRKATEDLLEYYKIGVSGIYTNDEIRQAGSKGNLLNQIMNSQAKKNAIFIDDAVEHLNTVTDGRIKCYFADWGYGVNTEYPVYRWS
jgi:phosphoglycolate phosphatase-like HAD superfamily hydrolase